MNRSVIKDLTCLDIIIIKKWIWLIVNSSSNHIGSKFDSHRYTLSLNLSLRAPTLKAQILPLNYGFGTVRSI